MGDPEVTIGFNTIIIIINIIPLYTLIRYEQLIPSHGPP